LSQIHIFNDSRASADAYDKKLRDIASSVQTVLECARKRRRKPGKIVHSITWQCTHLTAGQEMQYDSLIGGESPIESQESIDEAIRIVDALCQFAKDKVCGPDERRQIFALKNMVMLLLWNRRRDIYKGMWKHTSQGTDLACWGCDGSGEAPDSLEPCPKCHGTCVRKRVEGGSVFCVFALQGGNYSTTWHLPSSIVDRLLGNLFYGEDLVASHKWPAYDLRKTPVALTPEQYEHHRSYLAWFVTRSSGKK